MEYLFVLIPHACLQCSHEENFEWLNRVDDGKTVVKIGNPKTLEFQVVRTSLIPGLLKTIRENRSHPLPIKVFESTDVVFKDLGLERQARNARHAAAIWCNKTAGFEIVHGLLDKVMKTLEVKRISASDAKSESGYYLKEKDGERESLWLQRTSGLPNVHRHRPYILPRPCSSNLLSPSTIVPETFRSHCSQEEHQVRLRFSLRHQTR